MDLNANKFSKLHSIPNIKITIADETALIKVVGWLGIWAVRLVVCGGWLGYKFICIVAYEGWFFVFALVFYISVLFLISSFECYVIIAKVDSHLIPRKVFHEWKINKFPITLSETI